jgi:hypothetical protein
MVPGAVRTRQGRGVKLRPMTKWNKARRKVQRRLQWSRMRPRARRQGSKLRQGLVPSTNKTRWSGFSKISAKGKLEDYHARDGTSTLLVSTRAHTQSEETDSEVEGAEAKGRGSREGER